MDIKSVIGNKTPPRSITVDASLLRNFAFATSAKDPIYWDEKIAQQEGYPTIPAPPTFIFTLGNLAPEESFILDELNLDLGRLLHGEESFSYHAPIYAGDTITLETQVVDAYEKKGGALLFFVSDTRATNQHGNLVGQTSTTLVIR